ncbi:MAG: hypothetical protein JSW59_12115, partial [Phycisphaerales bacterium]
MKKILRRKRKGGALPLAIVAIIILLAMGVGLLTLGRITRVYAVRTSSGIAAQAAADSGLTMALFEMNEQLKAKSLNDSNLPEANKLLPCADSAFSYSVTRDSSGTYSIESTGTAQGIEKVVGCTLQVQGPFDYAIFAHQGMELINSAKVDWYNYDEEDSPLRIGTNSTSEGAVTLKNSAYINGDVVVGVGGDPDVAVYNDGEIEGDILVATQEHELPAITVHQWLQSLPSSGTINDDVTVSHSARYNGINLGSSETMMIDG